MCHWMLSATVMCTVVIGCVTGMEHGGADWITTEIEVRIRESHGDDDFINQTGVIRSISVRFLCLFTVVLINQNTFTASCHFCLHSYFILFFLHKRCVLHVLRADLSIC